MNRLAWCVTILTGLYASSCTETDVYDSEIRFETVRLEVGTLEKRVVSSGKIIPQKKVLVGSEVSGRVNEVHVDFNSPVRVGEVLAVIDSSNLESRIKQLDNQIEEAEANLKIQNVTIERVHTILQNVEIRLKRENELYQENATSLSALEGIQRDYAVTEADLKLAKITLLSRQASIKQLKAQLNEAKTNLSRTIIRSPIDGIVVEKKVEVGQTVQASFNAPELFVITNDLKNIYIDAKIPEVDIVDIDPGDNAHFSIEALPGRFITGTVKNVRYQPNINDNPVTYTTIIEARNSYDDLRLGMTVNVQIVTEKKEDVRLLPIEAERFRPSPDLIKANGSFSEKYDYLESVVEPVADILASIRVDETRIGNFRSHLENKVKTDIERLQDPTQILEHQNSKINIHETIDNILKNILDEAELIEFLSLYAEYNQSRDVELWLLTDSQLIERKIVKLGASDGSFVEVISGLTEDDAVITRVSK